MDLNKYLRNKDLQDLKFDTAYTEQSVPDILEINWKNILKEPRQMILSQPTKN